MAISFPNAAGDRGTVSLASGNTLTVPSPANIADGDLLLAVIYGQTFGTITTPTGWSLLYKATSGATRNFSVFYRSVTTASSEAASWTWTASVNSRMVGDVIRVLGAAASPIDSAPTSDFYSSSGPSTLPAPGVTAVNGAASLVVVSFTNDSTATPHTFSLPGASGLYTNSINDTSSTNMQVAQLSAAGPTGTQTVTVTPHTVTGGSFAFTLAPAAAVTNYSGAAVVSGAGSASVTGVSVLGSPAAASGSGGASVSGFSSTPNAAATAGVGGVSVTPTPKANGVVGATGVGTSSATKNGGAMPRMTRSGSQLLVGGTARRFAGTNMYWLGLNDNLRDANGAATVPTLATTQQAMDAAVGMNSSILRIHTFGINYGDAEGKSTPTVMPTLGNYNESTFRQLDNILYEATQRGLYIVAPVADRWNYYHGGAITFAQMVLGGTNTDAYYQNAFMTNATVKAAFKNQWLAPLLNRVSTRDGVAYKDQPAFAILELANEYFDADATWTSEMAAFVKSIAPNILVADPTAASGKYVTDSNVVLNYNATSQTSTPDANVDIFGGHFYPRDHWHLESDLPNVTAASRVWMTGEYDWTVNMQDGITKPSGQNITRAAWLSEIESTPGIAITMWWSLETTAAGVHSDGYELYSTPQNTEQTNGYNALKAHAAKVNPVAPTGFSGSAAGSGTGTVTVLGTPKPGSSAATSGSGTVTVTGVPKEAGTASTSGGGTVTASSVVSAAGPVSTTGTGSVAVSATSSSSAFGTAAASGSGSTVVSGGTSSTSVAALTGLGTVSVATTTALSALAAPSGTGTVTASGILASAGMAAVSGTGTASTYSSTSGGSTSASSGTGTVSVTFTSGRSTTVAVSGSGTVVAGSTSMAASGLAAASGIGTASTNNSTSGSSTSGTSGVGTVSVAVSVISAAVAAAITGTGTVVVSGHVTASGTVAATGTGTASAVSAGASYSGSAMAAGSGSASVSTAVVFHPTVGTSGVGTISLVSQHITLGYPLQPGGEGTATVLEGVLFGVMARAASEGSVSVSGSTMTTSTVVGATGEGFLTILGIKDITKFLLSFWTGAQEIQGSVSLWDGKQQVAVKIAPAGVTTSPVGVTTQQ